MTFSHETTTIISAASGIATIVASLVAIITLLIWKHQQRFSPKFQAIMELEDCYELLMHEYMESYNWFYQRFKLAAESSDNPSDYKRKVDEKIKSDYAELIKNNRFSELQTNYQLAYLRANRFDISLNDYETLSYKALSDFYEKNVACMESNNFKSQETQDTEAMRFANNYSSFKKAGLEHLKIIRTSL